MSGRIFAESANVYEDQAKVLFDFYRQTAEHIVAQEEEIEKNIAVAREEKAQFSAAFDQKKLLEKVGYGAAGLFIVLAVLLHVAKAINAEFPFPIEALLFIDFLALAPLGFAIYCFLQAKKLEQKISDTQTKITVFQQAHKEIPRDWYWVYPRGRKSRV
jgi:hypothetical protein